MIFNRLRTRTPAPRTPAPTGACPYGHGAPPAPAPAPPSRAPRPAASPPDFTDPEVAEEFAPAVPHGEPHGRRPPSRGCAGAGRDRRTGTYPHTPTELPSAPGSPGATQPLHRPAVLAQPARARPRGTSTTPEEIVDGVRRAPAAGATRRPHPADDHGLRPGRGPAGPAPRIWNEQLIRYAGYRGGTARARRPALRRLTDSGRRLGWRGGRARRSTCCRWWSATAATARTRAATSCRATRCWRCRCATPS